MCCYCCCCCPRSSHVSHKCAQSDKRKEAKSEGCEHEQEQTYLFEPALRGTVRKNDYRDDDDERDQDPEAPPLLLTGLFGRHDGRSEVLVPALHVLVRDGRVLLDLFDHGLLLFDRHGELVHHLCDLHELLFDVLDRFVAGLHGAQSGVGLPVAVGVGELLLEDIGVAVVVLGHAHCVVERHAGIGDLVLASLLRYDLGPEAFVFYTDVVQSLFNGALTLADMAGILRVGLGTCLQVKT